MEIFLGQDPEQTSKTYWQKCIHTHREIPDQIKNSVPIKIIWDVLWADLIGIGMGDEVSV